MADAKISELNALTGANLQGVDLLPIVDSDANNDGTLTDKETKSISITELRKNIISVTDSGGDGSLSYDSSGGTGVITYTGPSASDTRAHFSGGTGVDISSGSISIGQSVATDANVQFNQITVSGNIVPNDNETLDIGTSSLRFRDLYLSGDTLDLGGTKVNKNTDGDIEIRDSSNNFKKVKASEIELEDAQDASNKVVIRMDSSGTPELTKVNKTSGAAVETDVKFTTLTVAKNVTAGTAPTNDNHLTNKSYVDTQISTFAGSSNITTVGTLTSLAISGEISSTSTVSRPVQNDETDTTPIRNIRRMTQSDYDTLANASPTGIDDNTLYIIV